MKNSEMELMINEMCSSRRNRLILHDRLIDGEKIADIAEKYELSERQNVFQGRHRSADPHRSVDADGSRLHGPGRTDRLLRQSDA